MKRWKRGLFLFVSIGIVVMGVANFAFCDSITLSTQLGAGGGLWKGEDTDADGNLDAIHPNEDSWRVGIGTAAPSGTLDVQGGTAPDDTDGTDITLNAQDGGPTSLVTGTDGGNIILMPGSGVGTGSTGNVGIGTTNPLRKLHIVQDDPGSPTTVAVHNINTTPKSGATLISLRGNTTGEGATTFREAACIVGKIHTHDHATQSGSLRFHTRVSGLLKEILRIDDTGFVGINDGNPDALFEISQRTVKKPNLFMISSSYDSDGDQFIVKDSGNVGIGTTAPRGILDIRQASDARVSFEDGTTTNAIKLNFADDANSRIRAQFEAYRYQFFMAGIEKVRIDENGNVGIGTTTPGGSLDVNGTIYQRGSELHADYVFEPGYELESIEDHSAYMWQNKHLKAVPKAQKDEKGQDMVEYGARNRGILEELEKAHVYIQQLNERVKVLEAKLAERRS